MCIFPSSYHPPSPSHHYVFPGLLRKLLTGPSTSHLELCQSITQPKARVIVFQQEIWSCLQHSFPSPASVCSQDKDSSSHRDQSCCVMPVSWFHPPPYCLPLSPPLLRPQSSRAFAHLLLGDSAPPCSPQCILQNCAIPAFPQGSPPSHSQWPWVPGWSHVLRAHCPC